ncbi:hypothetical protein CJE1456 [Campylobacter jejuni RM1221]|nr:hypothetical protein CJE1456 [Campylobacter jejuni RM1221]AHN82896.1 hypothetical protein 00-1597CJIE4_4 [Campylobacter phage CJIE4-2]AHN82953.1 hypothetical protein 00-2425CJIE4_4 [Campylobacter phage CJIE4-3]AHN83011.1 hypothetical protein 00-6200CJIE4_4 [Campylobacter phage CJIE4-4]
MSSFLLSFNAFNLIFYLFYLLFRFVFVVFLAFLDLLVAFYLYLIFHQYFVFVLLVPRFPQCLFLRALRLHYLQVKPHHLFYKKYYRLNNT